MQEKIPYFCSLFNFRYIKVLTDIFIMKKTIILLSIVFSVFNMLAQSHENDTINVFEQDTAMRCHVDSLVLDAGSGYESYQWNTGESTRTIWVSATGTYIVTVSNGISQTDSCYVNLLNARIIQESTTICYKDTCLLEVNPSSYSYLWNNGDTDYFIFVEPVDTTTYSVIITDTVNTCYDSITLDVFPRIYVDFEQTILVCPGGECKGQVKATASGGLPPYQYSWKDTDVDPGDPSFAIGLCDDQYSITINDGYECHFDTSYEVKTYDMPDIEIYHVPDSVYIENPRVTFFFTNNSSDSIPLTTSSWDFGDGTKSNIPSPTHYYLSVEEYVCYFKYTTIDGCNDSIRFVIDVREIELDIPNVFTPNGDGINDYFEIKKLENFISNVLIIFNRWGKKVYEASNYQNNWDGDRLDDGVYYYVLKCKGYFDDDEFFGSIMILGKE
jgi:gliding motility-associated-like protein